MHFSAVAPPRGERGLKYAAWGLSARTYRRSPSWGAWIEIPVLPAACCSTRSRSPSWGAWIEIAVQWRTLVDKKVAPPRGERGLKFRVAALAAKVSSVAPPRGERGLKSNPRRERLQQNRRSPSWGAWIEIFLYPQQLLEALVAPPRGERGLKYSLH